MEGVDGFEVFGWKVQVSKRSFSSVVADADAARGLSRRADGPAEQAEGEMVPPEGVVVKAEEVEGEIG